MQHRRRIVGYATPEEIAADCLFETQGDVAEAQRLARRRIVSEDDYQHVAKLRLPPSALASRARKRE
jgi:hypothetical protein